MASLETRLAAAWPREQGVAPVIEGLRRLSSGASSETHVFDARWDSHSERCVVQLFAGGEQFGGALDKRVQGRVQALAAAAGIPTPAVRLILEADGEGAEGFVTAFIAGETLGKRIVADAAYALARAALPGQCAAALAGIHALAPAAFDFLPRRDAPGQLSELAALHRGYGDPLPVFEAALACLGERLPRQAETCVVHGDFRTGNLLVGPEGLRGILDWELTHLGDPMEDLGWLCMRSWRFAAVEKPVGGFGDRESFYTAYEAASGRAVRRDAVWFWETLGTLKWGVICQWFAARRLAGSIPGIEPAVIGRRVSEVELQLLDLMQGRGL